MEEKSNKELIMKSKCLMMGLTLLPVLNPAVSRGQPAISSVEKVTSTQSASERHGGGVSAGTAVPAGGESRTFYNGRTAGFVSIGGHRAGAETPLIIRFTEASEKDQASLVEDLSVMSVLLNKTLDNAGPSQASGAQYKMGIPLVMSGGTKGNQNTYVEGFGALFVMNAGFPLLPSAQSSATSPAAANNEWEAARRQLQGKSEAAGFGPGGDSPSIAYNEEAAKAFKKELLRALKNAANIRGLKPEEYLCVTVIGPEATAASGDAAGGGLGFSGGIGSKPGGKGEATDGLLRGGAAMPGGLPGRNTALSIKVSKKEIDLFASGKSTAEEFERNAQVTSYFVARGEEHGWERGIYSLPPRQ